MRPDDERSTSSASSSIDGASCSAESAERHVQALLTVEGMTCAACAARLEKVLNRRPGVQASVSFATRRARVDLEASKTDGQAVRRLIEQAGFTAPLFELEMPTATLPPPPDVTPYAATEGSPSEDAGPGSWPSQVVGDRRPGPGPVDVYTHALERLQQERAREERSAWLRLGLACLLSLPLVGEMLGMVSGHPHGSGAGIVEAGCATLVQLGVGWPFYRAAWSALRSGGANMDVLVVLGTTTAWLYSLWVVLGGAREPVYFEASAGVLLFVTMGRLVEARMRRRAGRAVESLARMQPQTALVERAGSLVEVAVGELQPGDIFVVPAGQPVPADALVIEGASAIDESLLSGESLPVDKGPGSRVLAATVNGMGVLRCRTLACGSSTMLAGILRLVEGAQMTKAPIALVADQVSAVFVPVVVLLAVVTLLGNVLWLGQGGEALRRAVAVLVVACPCALGLATPVALLVASGRAATLGLLFRNAAALERAGQVRTLLLDKTGTLTLGQPQVVKLVPLRGDEAGLLTMAASLEAASTHPLARAIVRAAEQAGRPLLGAAQVQVAPGGGLVGLLEGRRIWAGSARYIEHAAGHSVDPAWLAATTGEGLSVVLLADEQGLVGALSLADEARPASREALSKLTALGVGCVMLTGDRPEVAERIAHELGIEAVEAGLLPEGKVAAMQRHRPERGLVAMVGDGLNDAPVLAAVDLGFAMGGGAALASEVADVILMRDDLRDVAQAIELSRATLRVIRQNLFFAFAYNVLMLPLASCGYLQPMWAGAAMAASSLSVVLSSLRLAGAQRPDPASLRPTSPSTSTRR
jgi:P-type Cu+ transporter